MGRWGSCQAGGPEENKKEKKNTPKLNLEWDLVLVMRQLSFKGRCRMATGRPCLVVECA